MAVSRQMKGIVFILLIAGAECARVRRMERPPRSRLTTGVDAGMTNRKHEVSNWSTSSDAVEDDIAHEDDFAMSSFISVENGLADEGKSALEGDMGQEDDFANKVNLTISGDSLVETLKMASQHAFSETLKVQQKPQQEKQQQTKGDICSYDHQTYYANVKRLLVVAWLIKKNLLLNAPLLLEFHNLMKAFNADASCSILKDSYDGSSNPPHPFFRGFGNQIESIKNAKDLGIIVSWDKGNVNDLFEYVLKEKHVNGFEMVAQTAHRFFFDKVKKDIFTKSQVTPTYKDCRFNFPKLFEEESDCNLWEDLKPGACSVPETREKLKNKKIKFTSMKLVYEMDKAFVVSHKALESIGNPKVSEELEEELQHVEDLKKIQQEIADGIKNKAKKMKGSSDEKEGSLMESGSNSSESIVITGKEGSLMESGSNSSESIVITVIALHIIGIAVVSTIWAIVVALVFVLVHDFFPDSAMRKRLEAIYKRMDNAANITKERPESGTKVERCFRELRTKSKLQADAARVSQQQGIPGLTAPSLGS